METIRVALIGPSGSGKSGLVHRLCGQPFEPRYFPTYGGENSVLNLPGFRFEITEFGGQERYSTSPQGYDAYIIVTTSSKLDCNIALKMQDKLPDNIPNCVVLNTRDNQISLPNVMTCSVKRNQNLLEPFRVIAAYFSNNVNF
jgi:GTPase SAR1 family protein